MTLDPILSAPFTVQLHVIGAVTAIVVGPFALLRRSRDIWHRAAGYVWVVAMALTAVSSFWISGFAMIGPFGPIHILSVLTLVSLVRSILAVRGGDVARHQSEMRGLYFWALGVAGLFTFLPGRRMNLVFGGLDEWLVFGVATVVIGGGLLWYMGRNRRVAVG